MTTMTTKEAVAYLRAKLPNFPHGEACACEECTAIRTVCDALEASERGAVPVGTEVVWQFRDRGGDDWRDADSIEHAERVRRTSHLVRAVVIVSPVSDTPVNKRELYAAPPKPAEAKVPEGFVMVPVEPTGEMLAAGAYLSGQRNYEDSEVRNIYQDMLAASGGNSSGKEV